MLISLVVLALTGQVDTLNAATVFSSRNTTIQVQKLEGETLQRLSSESVADALKYFSGVQVKDYGGVGGLKTVNVRSLGSQHTAIYYNGVRLTNAQNGQIDLGRYSLDNVESITLYNGQKSEVLQTASDVSAASSIYIQQKIPSTTNTEVSFKTGSFGTYNPKIYSSYVNSKVKLALSTEYLSTNGRYRFKYRYPAYDTTVVRYNGDIHAYRMEGIASFKGARISGYYYSSERGLPGPVIRRVSDQYLVRDRQTDEDWFIQGTYRKLWNKFVFQGVAKYSKNFVHYRSNVDRNAAAMSIDNVYHQNELYGSLALAWYPNSIISFGLSADERWADLDCDVNGFSYVQRFVTLLSANMQILLKGFKIQPCILYTNSHDNTNLAARDKSIFTPAVFASYSKDWVTVRAFYKEIFRLPTFNDLYYTTVGYRNLKPEYTKQFSLGVEANKYGFTISLEGYYNNVTDKIVAMPIQNQFSWSMVNFGKVKGYGSSVKLGWAHSKKDWNLNCFSTYTFEVAEDYTNPTSKWYRGQVPYTPWHSASFILDGEYKSYGASLSFLFTGLRYRNVANLRENRLSPWKTTDISLYKNLRVLRNDARISLNLNNVFNQPYEVVTNYPMPGFNMFLKLSLTI